MVKNIIIGWWRFFRKKDTEESKMRMKICRNCEYNDKNFCDLCGCYLPAKTKVESEICHANKW